MKLPSSTAKIVRYGLAALGPVGAAVAQFVLSLQLLHVLVPAQFGSVSFLLVTSQLSFSILSALLCAPFPILLLEPGRKTEAVTQTFLSMNLVLAGVSFVVFSLIGLSLGFPPPIACLFAAYAAVMDLRWFGRAFAYAHNQQFRTVGSDLLYGGLLLASVLAMMLSGAVSLQWAYIGLLGSAAAALVPFGPRFLKGQFLQFSPAALRAYGEVWNKHAKWSLSGVVTTEATSNAHVYIVTLLAGPAAFAPLAASALLVRPLATATNALTDFERPHLARQLAQNGARIGNPMRMFSFLLWAVWLASAVAGLLLMVIAPHLVFPDHYALATLAIGAALWFTIAGIRTLRTPNSVLMQAAGQFRHLAYASYVSCGISLVSVVVITLLAGPLWSLAGVAAGEAVFAIMTAIQVRRWRIRASAIPAAQPQPA